MDWADDITYAIHDLVDFYCAGLIPLHSLVEDEDTRFFTRTCNRVPKIQENGATYQQTFHAALQVRPLNAPYVGSQRQSRDLWSFVPLSLAGTYRP